MYIFAMLLMLLLSITTQADSNNAESGRLQSFKADWDSLKAYECPKWFQDAKFGIYAHWGPYSVSKAPGNTDWYSRNMYKKGHGNNNFHIKTYGPVNEFGYKDFVPLFTAEKFDADEWADLYVEAGAQFAGPVGEHADGFSMWDSDVNPWNAVDKGPKRDVVAEMEKAVRKRGLKFLVSLHHQWHWKWYPTWDKNTDCADPEFASLYWVQMSKAANGDTASSESQPFKVFEKIWLEKVKEVVTRYSPDLLWFDSRMKILPEQTRQEMAAFYYNHALKNGQEPVLTFKRPDLPEGVATIDIERGRMPDIFPEPWLTDTSVSRESWSWTSDLSCYTTNRLVDDLVDIVSKNGCLLLNIAPHPDGTIPNDQKERLRGIGKWLKLNGEAIYGSRPWTIYGEGPTKTKAGNMGDLHLDGFKNKDVRFTTKNDVLYAIALGWPDEGRLNIKSLGLLKYPTAIKNVSLIGHSEKLNFKQTKDNLVITLPAKKPCEHAFVFRID